MAFSGDERARILYYLGYSVFEDDGPAVRALNSLDAKESTGGTVIRDLLGKLDDIDQDIHQTRSLSKAIEDGSIKLRAHYTLEHLWRMGRSYVARLAGFMKVAIVTDVFSVGGNVRNPDTFYSQDPSAPTINPITGTPTRTY